MIKRKLILIFMVILIGLGAFALPKLEFSTDISELQLATEADLETYHKITAHFPQETAGIIVILGNENGFSSRSDFQKIDSITAFIESFDEVETVSSITNLEVPHKGLFNPILKKYIDLSSDSSFAKWQEHYLQFDDINQKFISKDKTYNLLYINSEKGLTKVHVQDLKSWSTVNNHPDLFVYQPNLTEALLKSEWIYETLILATLCILFLLSSFYFFTKSFLGLGLIVFMVLFNVACTTLFMVSLDIPFNVQMIALPCLIIIFSFTDIMHILYHHTQLLQAEIGLKELHNRLITQLKHALFLTSFSNVFGFIIFFILSDNQSLTELASVSIATVTIAYLSGRYLVIPLLGNRRALVNLKRINRIHQTTEKLINTFHLSRRKALFIVVPTLLLLFVIVVQTFKIDSLTNNFNTSDPDLRKSHEILTNHFYGSKSIEVLIRHNKQETNWNLANLRQIQQVEEEIDHLFHPHYIVSPVTIVKRYHRYLIQGKPTAYKLPQNISASMVDALNSHYIQLGGEQLIAKDANFARILIGFDEEGLAVSREKYKALTEILTMQSNSEIEFQLTGRSYIADQGTFKFTQNLIYGWGIGILLSSFVMMIFLKSILKGIAIFIVNVLPILLVVYLMPYFGLNINPQSLFLLTILAGLCVDDSIYIILNRVEKRTALSYYPIIITSVVLAAGFLAFGFSTYSWLSPFAWLFIIGIGVALVLDLFILPLFMFKSTDQDV